MKTIGVLLILTVLVAGVAVNGSRAQPLPATSVAFQQCLDGENRSGARCRPFGGTLIAMEEIGLELAGARADVGEIGGDIAGAGDDFLRDLAARALEAFLVSLARVLVQALIRGSGLPVSPDVSIDSTLFDPVR